MDEVRRKTRKKLVVCLSRFVNKTHVIAVLARGGGGEEVRMEEETCGIIIAFARTRSAKRKSGVERSADFERVTRRR